MINSTYPHLRPQEKYELMYMSCYPPARTGCLLTAQERTEIPYFRLKHRDTKLVQEGAARRDVDDILEYALRMATGSGAPQDEDIAMKMLMDVIESDFPSNKRAVAANLASFLFIHRTESDEDGFSHAVELCQLSIHLGHYAHIAVFLFLMCSQEFDIVLPLDARADAGPIGVLFDKYDRFQEETGFQPFKSTHCVACGTKRQLRRCSGQCAPFRKPMYCNRECQKADWVKHRKWCVVPVIEEDPDKDTAVYRLHLASAG
ncbi:hypothetical protein NLJ89_g3933 [Agrocybe chaxingu]|uniref:MYND-type domain-containing protein n=1 Tax=Agrocybe chaxingu TaxID=84603 RepID=A0A9W8MWE8_9AGAR|nr:hypothetical protein NLJ89_g3933 [Agrocybe chaxingu]